MKEHLDRELHERARKTRNGLCAPIPPFAPFAFRVISRDSCSKVLSPLSRSNVLRLELTHAYPTHLP